MLEMCMEARLESPGSHAREYGITEKRIHEHIKEEQE